jgi:hypothetical protein
MMSALRKSDLNSIGLSVLVCESVDACGTHCAECGEEADRNGKLLQYGTQIGPRVRVHDGLFCCKDCHDVWHGLRPRR